MSVEWQDTTIGAVCLKVFSGGTPISTNPSYYGGAIPWLRTKEVNYGKVFDTEQHITELGLENSSAKLVPVNSVIVAMYGNGDTAGRVAVNKIPLTPNQACCNLVVDPAKADFRFVYYFLMGRYQELVDLKNGGAQQNLNGQLIKAFPFCAPDVCEQSAIADVFESLDDRITLLRETNATLEAIAQALFKSWFVDFDPVRAKMEGRAPEGMDEATAALFPDALEESELGWVPKGWRFGEVGDFAELKKGTVNPGMQPDTVFEHFSLPAFDDGQRPVIERGATIKSNKTPVPSDAVLLSKLNPHIPRIWLPGTSGRNAICSTEFLVFQPTAASCRELIYCVFSSTSFIGRLQQLVTGTSNSHQRIKPDQVAKIEHVVPTPTVVRAFESLAAPLFERVHANRMQAQTLATIRDTLLPRLISGQLRLPEAQALLKETV